MKKLQFSLILAIVASTLVGCATSNLLGEPSQNHPQATTTAQQVLINDRVIAFARPAAGTNIDPSSAVIVGENQSYVLTNGGYQLINLISQLTPENFSVNNDLRFYSANDGKFSGKMALSYVALERDLHDQDKRILLQNGAKNCTSAADVAMGAQRYCFDIAIDGIIYPRVNNYELVRRQFTPLTHPYSVTIYSTGNATSPNAQRPTRTGAEKLVLLPFALAFDVVTLPVQVLSAL